MNPKKHTNNLLTPAQSQDNPSKMFNHDDRNNALFCPRKTMRNPGDLVVTMCQRFSDIFPILGGGVPILQDNLPPASLPERKKRDKLNGTNKFLPNLRFPAVFFENLRLQNAAIPREICTNLANISEILRENCEFDSVVPLSLSLLVLLDIRLTDQIFPKKILVCCWELPPQRFRVSRTSDGSWGLLPG